MGSTFGGAASPLRSNLRVFLQGSPGAVSPVQPKYLPKRPVFKLHLAGTFITFDNWPFVPFDNVLARFYFKPLQSGLLPQTCSLRVSSIR